MNKSQIRKLIYFFKPYTVSRIIIKYGLEIVGLPVQY
jgi:hypothetical protein